MLRSAEIALQSGRFRYLSAGDDRAPLVVCLHGFPDTAESFRELLPALAAAGFRAVAPWLRGFAPSTIEGPFSVGRIADDLFEMVDAFSPDEPALVVGHDWGALATWIAISRDAHRFSGAVVLGLPHPHAFLANVARHPSQLVRSWYVLLFQLPRLAELCLGLGNFRLVDLLWRLWAPRLVLDARRQRALKHCLAASTLAPVGYYRLGVRGVRALLQETLLVQTPLLHIHGARDGCIDVRLCRGEERWVSAPYRLAIYEDVGHFPHLEQPGCVARDVTRWFAGGVT